MKKPPPLTPSKSQAVVKPQPPKSLGTPPVVAKPKNISESVVQARPSKPSTPTPQVLAPVKPVKTVAENKPAQLKNTPATQAVAAAVVAVAKSPKLKLESKAAGEALVKIKKVVAPKKVKLVRDSFTIPKSEYQVLDVLKQRAIEQKYPIKKAELLRAGIKALERMDDAAFVDAIKAVPNLKTGRPGK